MHMTVTISEARAELPKLIDAVEEGHEVTITRHGHPVAVMMNNRAARRHRTARMDEGVARLRRIMDSVRDQPLPERGTLDPDVAEAWVAEIRADRDAED